MMWYWVVLMIVGIIFVVLWLYAILVFALRRVQINNLYEDFRRLELELQQLKHSKRRGR
jgi:hypothetical protein